LEFEGIPDFALQPAKEADEYSYHYMPKGVNSRFDPAAYERVLHETAKQAAETEQVEIPVFQDEQTFAGYDDTSENTAVQAAVAQVAVQDAAEGFPAYGEPALEAVPEVIPVSLEAEIISEDQEDAALAATKAEDEAILEEVPHDAASAAADILGKGAGADEEAAMGTITFTEAIKAKNWPDLPFAFADKEKKSEAIHNLTAPFAKRPVLQPTPVPKAVPVKAPVVGSLMSSKLKLVDMKQKNPLRVSLEEDILVPDVKPDLARILTMDGKVKLSDREIHTGQTETDSVRISGDLLLQTLYVPETNAEGDPIVAIESKIPFKNDAEMKAGPYSDLAVVPSVESIDFTVVNERKFRVRATIVFHLKEYSNVDIEVFEGLRDEEVQMLKERIKLTDVALRKTETAEIKDDLALKENMPEISKILKYDVSVVENHKQITKEKAVINASVNCNILYLGAEGNNDAAAADTGAQEENSTAVPVLYQGKTEFTQFIRLDGEHNPGDQNPAGSKINFKISSLNLTAKEDGNGKRGLFELDMNVDTGLELYKNVEKEVVTDVYHHKKDVQFDTDEIGVLTLGGSGVAEISAREIINVPDRYGSVDKVIYVNGTIKEKRSTIEQTKSVVEGTVRVSMICTSADERKTIFSIEQEIPFRSAMEIPGITPDMTANNDIALKEIWFDKINNKQIEVNAGILVNTVVATQERHQLVKSVSFQDSPQDSNPVPGIILYISRTGDTIWNIAKKYRTTIDEIKKINDLEYGKEINPGTKLLIVAKNY
ncbi:MAG: hypothetical protein K0Q48_1170, partial [Bacillota bacterium]|nr:hypothetical protein [Bacillota bacterium]